MKKVIKTVHLTSGSTYRRIQTPHGKITTYERRTGEELIVIKKDGRRVGFDPYRVFVSAYNAFYEAKKSDSGESVDMAKKVLGLVLEKLYCLNTKHITTKQLSKVLENTIKHVDYRAAMRYTSNYK